MTGWRNGSAFDSSSVFKTMQESKAGMSRFLPGDISIPGANPVLFQGDPSDNPDKRILWEAVPSLMNMDLSVDDKSVIFYHDRSFMFFAGVDGVPSPLGLTVQDYKSLMDRGWRRSGNLLYKPDLANSCCQEYTIRLNALDFKPSRDQRQTLHRWSKYVLGEKYLTEAAKLHPQSKEDKKRKRNEFDFIETIHQPEHSFVKTPPEPEHKLEIRLEENVYSDEKYELFKHYQETVHKDFDNSKRGFKRFLCTNPFKPPYSTTPEGKKLGAYHQCYYLDGRLVAISVIDLLPDCVSGVYFIYHEDIGKWSPGKLSALRETALAVEEGYKYYYMGFYIHTCPKMRYKCAYGPSYLLDPEYYDWHLFDDDFRNRLETTPYISLTKEKKVASGEITSSDSTIKSKVEEEKEEENITLTETLDTDPSDEEDDIDSESSATVFQNKMSGAMTLKEVQEKVDLGQMKVMIGKQVAFAEWLQSWERQKISDHNSIKSRLAEIAATVGEDMASKVIVLLSLR